MTHRIHTAHEKSSAREAFSVIATFLDWDSAFVRPCLKLGIIIFFLEKLSENWNNSNPQIIFPRKNTDCKI